MQSAAVSSLREPVTISTGRRRGAISKTRERAVQAVKRRERVVGQDHVGPEVAQRGQELLARLDPQGGELHLSAPQRPFRQLGVGEVVLQDQDARLLAHDDLSVGAC